MKKTLFTYVWVYVNLIIFVNTSPDGISGPFYPKPIETVYAHS